MHGWRGKGHENKTLNDMKGKNKGKEERRRPESYWFLGLWSMTGEEKEALGCSTTHSEAEQARKDQSEWD